MSETYLSILSKRFFIDGLRPSKSDFLCVLGMCLYEHVNFVLYKRIITYDFNYIKLITLIKVYTILVKWQKITTPFDFV